MSFKKLKNEKRASSREDFEEIGIQLGDMAAPGKITILIFIPHYKAKEAVQPWTVRFWALQAFARHPILNGQLFPCPRAHGEN